MKDSIRERGMHATGMSDIVRDARAPKGVLYHHFPGGKVAVTVAAIDDSVDELAISLRKASAAGHGVLESLERWVVRSAEMLYASGFRRGCPLATVALETTPDDVEIRHALDRGFARLRSVIAEQLVQEGHSVEEAGRIAFALVAVYEGGLLQARVSGEIEPMLNSTRYLVGLMRTR